MRIDNAHIDAFYRQLEERGIQKRILCESSRFNDGYAISSDDLNLPAETLPLPLPDWVADFLKRRNEVEQVLRLPLWKQQKGEAMPEQLTPEPLTPNCLWELADRLSIPGDVTASLAKTHQ